MKTRVDLRMKSRVGLGMKTRKELGKNDMNMKGSLYAREYTDL